MGTNQVNTLLPSLPKSKKKEVNIFQLIIAGSFSNVKRFWIFLKSSSGYKLFSDYRYLFDQPNQKEDIHLVLQVEEGPNNLSSFQKKGSTVEIRTEDGKNIKFSLLDAQVVEMLNGMVYIQGKSYDIFVNPLHDRRNERELIDCKVVDETERVSD